MVAYSIIGKENNEWLRKDATPYHKEPRQPVFSGWKGAFMSHRAANLHSPDAAKLAVTRGVHDSTAFARLSEAGA